MTTNPTPTGKIRGAFRDVTPKLRNFTGAVKVTTPSGKGGILVEMGRPVASYLTSEGELHRGKESLEILEREQLADFEILRYDDEQFREAMIICDNRGLLLGEEKGAAAPPRPPARPQPREAKPREEENVLSAMMKRFGAPKAPPIEEPPRQAKPEARPVPPPPVSVTEREAPPVQETLLPPPPEKKVATPAQEADLSAIIRRLRESAKAEKAPAGPKAEEAPAKPAIPEPARAADSAASPVPMPEPAQEEKAPAAPAAPSVPAAGIAQAPEGMGPEGRVKVDLGKMMKRIKRLDITSIREELQAGAESAEGLPGEAPGAAAPSAAGVEGPAPAPAEAAQEAEARGRSDIDELKAFIQRLEVLEQPPEEAPPEEKGIFAKLGIKSQPAEAPAPPRKREVPLPISRRAKPPEEPAVEEEVKPQPAPAEERAAPQPPEPDRKAKITSLLRRSGLVKPPVEEQPREPVPRIEPEPVVHREREEVPAQPPEAEVRVPRPQRKKVEITRVPKIPERPPREPPLIDERMLQRILKQPGVIAVSTFFEGFAVQSAGKADFEQVAANAEDLFRAGKKIAREIELGPLNQIILETGRGKLVIAPYGDLNVCIFTEPDANLGLIRVAIRSMQLEKD